MRPPNKRRGKFLNLRNLLLLSFFALFAVGISTGAVIETSQPSFCKVCHEMNQNYQAWRKSKHKDVACVDCHVKPGLQNYLLEKVNALKEVADHFTGKYNKPINANSDLSRRIPDGNCLPCHPKTGQVTTKIIRYNHSAHDRGEHRLKCAFCHNRTGHAGLAGYENRLSMKVCVDCHKKEEGPTRNCGACHPKDFPVKPASHQAQNWIKIHGDRSGHEDCLRCHTKKFCDDCHGIEIPHPGKWKSSHEEASKHINKAVCNKCHEKKFCDDCHRREGD